MPKLHYSSTREEIVDHLRTLAIRDSLGPIIIDAIDSLEEPPDGWIAEEDHLQRVDEANSQGFNMGRDAGHAEGEQEAENKLDHERDEIIETAHAEGHAAALAASERATDVARVDALLQALEKIRALCCIADGVTNETNAPYRKRPAKVGELKRAMLDARYTAFWAIEAYRKPNEDFPDRSDAVKQKEFKANAQ